MRPAYKYPAIALSALALFILSFFVLISGNDVEKILKVELREKSGIDFIADDFSKSFPLGFTATGVKLSAGEFSGNPGQTEIVELEDLQVSLSIFPLIFGKKNLTYLARLGNGKLEGKAVLDESAELNVRASEVALNAFTPLRELGVNGWRVSGTADFISTSNDCPQGRTKLDFTDIDFKGLRSPIPLMLFGSSVSASLSLETDGDCVVEITGLFIEGYALNAKLNGVIRIKSPIKRSLLDLKVEIFTKPGNAGNGINNFLTSFMKEYKKKSGHYLLSLKGTIGNPSVKR